jgi:uncharacterized damage-inducible protein DinB
MRDENDPVTMLLEYDHGCTDKLAGKIELLYQADLVRRFPIGHLTLHASFYHLVTIAEKWTDRSRPIPTGVIGKTYPGPDRIAVKELRERYRVAARQMMVNISALHSTSDCMRDYDWEIKRNHLIHIITHGMHHRAQIINMLTQLGVTNIIEGGDFGGWANRRVRNRTGKARK